MLASTVQFSRYGRPPHLALRVRHVAPFGEVKGRTMLTYSVSRRLGLICPLPQDSTVCLRRYHDRTAAFHPTNRSTGGRRSCIDELVSVPPLSYLRETFAHEQASGRHPSDAA